MKIRSTFSVLIYLHFLLHSATPQACGSWFLFSPSYLVNKRRLSNSYLFNRVYNDTIFVLDSFLQNDYIMNRDASKQILVSLVPPKQCSDTDMQYQVILWLFSWRKPTIRHKVSAIWMSFKINDGKQSNQIKRTLSRWEKLSRGITGWMKVIPLVGSCRSATIIHQQPGILTLIKGKMCCTEALFCGKAPGFR